MGKLTDLFKDYKNLRIDKLYAYCDLYESVNKFYELDDAAEKAVKKLLDTHTPERISDYDNKAAVGKFIAAKKFSQSLLDKHKKQIENELKSKNYGQLGQEICNILGLKKCQEQPSTTKS